MNAEVKSIWNIIDFGTYGNICRWGAILLHLTYPAISYSFIFPHYIIIELIINLQKSLI